MAETKILADGTTLSVWFALPNYAANWRRPTAAEINASVDITESVAWDNFSFGAQASTQTADPSLKSIGNSQSRGFSQFGGSMSFYYPSSYVVNAGDPSYVTFATLKNRNTLGYIIIRADGRKTTSGAADSNKAAQTGDFVSIYKVVSDGYSDVITGDVNFKYTISFQPQGSIWINAYVGTPTVATPAPIGTTAYTVGGRTPLSSYITGRQLAAVAGQWSGTPGWLTWSSSNNAVAQVDQNGVVKGIAAGTATITATHDPSGVASTPLSITIA
jgi:hypothetical protein